MMSWIKSILAIALHGHLCIASVFGYPGDRWAGGRAICLHRRVRHDDVGIAHRTLPCGSRVALLNPRTMKMVVATVVDRGPYGALLPDGTWVLKLSRHAPGRWRGAVDLTPATARILGHNGFEKILYAALGKGI